ncbi:MAG: hypothetical protein JJU35_03915 [Balneolales bacterium]|nr:hypothetical protein [Balneolales bacterium]
MINLLLLRLLLSALLLPQFMPPAAQDVTIHIDAPAGVVEVITTDGDLTNDNIKSIQQDENGFLWLATDNGINRYDGYTYKPYVLDSGSNRVFSEPAKVLFKDSANIIWSTTESGNLYFYDEWEDRFVFTDLGPEIRLRFEKAPLLAIIGNQANGWVLGNSDGLLRLSPDYELTEIAVSGTGHITSIHSDHANQRLYLSGFRSGIFRYEIESGELSAMPELNEALNLYATNFIGKTHDGQFYVIEHHIIYHFSDEGLLLQEYETYPFQIYRAQVDPNGDLWFMQGFDIQKYDRSTQIATNLFRVRGAISLFTDQKNTLWIGTSTGMITGKGLMKYRFISGKMGFKKEPFLETAMPGFRGKVMEDYPVFLTGAHHTTTVLVDPDDDELFWILTSELGLFTYHITTLELTRFPVEYPPVSADTKSINHAFYRDESGTFYIITNNGLVIFRETEGILQLIPREEIFGMQQGVHVNMILKAGDTIWLASAETAVVSYNLVTGQSKTYLFDTVGRFSFELNHAVALTCMDANPCLEIWAISSRSGLYKIDTLSETIEFVSNPTINQSAMFGGLSSDADQNLWIGTNLGIIRYHPQTDSAVRYTERDGIPGQNFFRNDVLRYPDGTLLFCGNVGCNKFHPEILQPAEASIPVAFTDVIIKDQSVMPYSSGWFVKDGENRPGLQVHWRDQVLRFKFAALHFSESSQNRYKYRLTPYINEWIEIGNSTELTFTNLNPGRYLLEVKGGDRYGNWSTEAASMPLSIIPPFWMRTSFRISIGLFFTIFVIGISWNAAHRRYKNQLQQLEYKLAVDRERLRISRDMHDNIGSRLTQVKMMSEHLATESETETGKEIRLQELSDETAEIMLTMSEIVWSLNPKNDFLENLAGFIVNYADSFCRKCGISCRIQVPPELPDLMVPSATRHHLLNVLKEALNNAIRHSGCTQISLSLSYTPPSVLEVLVRDNGSGFCPDSTPNKFGNGLTSMRERMKECGGRLELESAEGTGTEIRLKCPINA